LSSHNSYYITGNITTQSFNRIFLSCMGFHMALNLMCATCNLFSILLKDGLMMVLWLKLVTSKLTLILLTWRIRWANNNANKWQMGFNTALKGLNNKILLYLTDTNKFIIVFQFYNTTGCPPPLPPPPPPTKNPPTGPSPGRWVLFFPFVPRVILY